MLKHKLHFQYFKVSGYKKPSNKTKSVENSKLRNIYYLICIFNYRKIQNFTLRGRLQITSRFWGEGGKRIYDNPNTKFFFIWKICDKGGGSFEKVFFLRDVICELPLILDPGAYPEIF